MKRKAFLIWTMLIGISQIGGYNFQYTEDGYLFFDRYHMEGYDGPSECVALRIVPLDETCIAWNEKYMLPVGYERNNLFLCDWSEADFGEVDFYDLFDIFYEDVYGKEMPYLMNEDTAIGNVYQIPAKEFETVIQSHFQIDAETLRERTTYLEALDCYEYRPRGLYDCEQPKHPYPEVVDYREEADGTIILTVNAVYPEEYTAKAFVHEVTVRPLEDGSFQYVSNRILEECTCEPWYVQRLTEEMWKEIYE